VNVQRLGEEETGSSRGLDKRTVGENNPKGGTRYGVERCPKLVKKTLRCWKKLFRMELPIVCPKNFGPQRESKRESPGEPAECRSK